jgi:hypothetical protein
VNITSTKVTETFGTTIMNSVRGTKLQSGVPLPPFQTNLKLDSFVKNKATYCSPWEAVLIRFDSVYVSNHNPDSATSNPPGANNGEFSFNRKVTDTVGLRVDDMAPDLKGLNLTLKKGKLLHYVQGPMWFSFSNYKMIPRNLTDLDLAPPVITILGANPDSVIIGHSYNDPGATAMDDIDGDLTTMIVKTSTLDSSVLGTDTIWYKATDSWGNVGAAIRVVKVIANTGVKENELTQADVKLYPNPAGEQINISANAIQTVPVTVSVIDILGKTVISKTYTQKQFTDAINISTLDNGVYFCNFKNEKSSRTLKFVVSK